MNDIFSIEELKKIYNCPQDYYSDCDYRKEEQEEEIIPNYRDTQEDEFLL